MTNNELYHYGVLGMKWGRRKAKTSTDSKNLGKAAKRFDKKVSRGSLYSIQGMALEDMGYKKAADRAYRKADFKEAKWGAKANRAKKIKKVYDSMMSDLNKLERQGRGNDVDAVIKRTKLYDSQINDIKSEYSKKNRGSPRASSRLIGR